MLAHACAPTEPCTLLPGCLFTAEQRRSKTVMGGGGWDDDDTPILYTYVQQHYVQRGPLGWGGGGDSSAPQGSVSRVGTPRCDQGEWQWGGGDPWGPRVPSVAAAWVAFGDGALSWWHCVPNTVPCSRGGIWGQEPSKVHVPNLTPAAGVAFGD